MKKIVKAFLVIGSAVALLAMQGCEVSGGVVIIPPNYPPHQQVHCWYDYYGIKHCDTYRPLVGRNLTNIAGDYMFTTTDGRVAAVSNKYDISHYAATYIVRATLLADQKDMSGVEAIGLTENDLKDIYAGKTLSAEKNEILGKKLMMKTSEVDRLVTRMAGEFKDAAK